MKTKLMFMILVLISGCGARPRGDLDLVYEGSARSFTTVASPLIRGVIELSAVNFLGTQLQYVDTGAVGNFDLIREGVATHISKDMRFSYVTERAGTVYAFYKSGTGVYLKVSTDGENFILANSGLPVLTETPGTDYAAIWNVGVAIDDNGIAHMLIECSPGFTDYAHVGLGYATSLLDLNGTIDFNSNRSANQVIEHAGNAWVGFVPGKGLISIYGVTSKPEGAYGTEWYVRAATMALGSNDWITSENFVLGKPGIHVCDPHLVETESGLDLFVSFDQYTIYKASSRLSMEQLFDSI